MTWLALPALHHAHAPDAVCTPTRYGLLTGRYCFRSRLKSGVLGPWGAPLIEEGRPSRALPGELYNLQDDLSQRRNRYGEKPEIVERLRALLEKYKADARSTPGLPQKNDPALDLRKKGGPAVEKSE